MTEERKKRLASITLEKLTGTWFWAVLCILATALTFKFVSMILKISYWEAVMSGVVIFGLLVVLVLLVTLLYGWILEYGSQIHPFGWLCKTSDKEEEKKTEESYYPGIIAFEEKDVIPNIKPATSNKETADNSSLKEDSKKSTTKKKTKTTAKKTTKATKTTKTTKKKTKKE